MCYLLIYIIISMFIFIMLHNSIVRNFESGVKVYIFIALQGGFPSIRLNKIMTGTDLL